VNWVGDTQGNQHEWQPAVTRLGIDPISDDCRADLGGKVVYNRSKDTVHDFINNADALPTTAESWLSQQS